MTTPEWQALAAWVDEHALGDAQRTVALLLARSAATSPVALSRLDAYLRAHARAPAHANVNAHPPEQRLFERQNATDMWDTAESAVSPTDLAEGLQKRFSKKPYASQRSASDPSILPPRQDAASAHPPKDRARLGTHTMSDPELRPRGRGTLGGHSFVEPLLEPTPIVTDAEYILANGGRSEELADLERRILTFQSEGSHPTEPNGSHLEDFGSHLEEVPGPRFTSTRDEVPDEDTWNTDIETQIIKKVHRAREQDLYWSLSAPLAAKAHSPWLRTYALDPTHYRRSRPVQNKFTGQTRYAECHICRATGAAPFQELVEEVRRQDEQLAAVHLHPAYRGTRRVDEFEIVTTPTPIDLLVHISPHEFIYERYAPPRLEFKRGAQVVHIPTGLIEREDRGPTFQENRALAEARLAARVTIITKDPYAR